MESDGHASSFLESPKALPELDRAHWIHQRTPLRGHSFHQPTLTTQPAELVHDHRLCDLEDIGRSATGKILAAIAFQDPEHRALDQVVPCRGQQAVATGPEGAFQNAPKGLELLRLAGHTWAS